MTDQKKSASRFRTWSWPLRGTRQSQCCNLDRDPNLMALFFLLVVFGFIVLLIVAFIFPPTKWAQWMSSADKNKDKDNKK